uniref:Uncharacterized protein n=1 Tax=Micrurus carvalhoi TaxID=3147026 RepID=A0A2H6NEF7_9SAUR
MVKTKTIFPTNLFQMECEEKTERTLVKNLKRFPYTKSSSWCWTLKMQKHDIHILFFLTFFLPFAIEIILLSLFLEYQEQSFPLQAYMQNSILWDRTTSFQYV